MNPLPPKTDSQKKSQSQTTSIKLFYFVYDKATEIMRYFSLKIFLHFIIVYLLDCLANYTQIF